MFQSVRYKNKNYLLLALAVVFGWMAWKYAFAKTFHTAYECARLEQMMQEADDAALTMAALQQEAHLLNRQLGGNGTSVYPNVNQELYDYLSRYCGDKKLRIHEFSEPHNYMENDYNIRSGKVIIRGNYVDLIKMIHNLENNFTSARIASVHFFSEKNPQTKKTNLYAQLWFQHIEKV